MIERGLRLRPAGGAVGAPLLLRGALARFAFGSRAVPRALLRSAVARSPL